MSEKKTHQISEAELAAAFTGEDAKAEPKKTHKQNGQKWGKIWLILLISGIVFLVAGVASLIVAFFGIEAKASDAVFPTIPSENAETSTYSPLTGEVLSDASLATAPTYCVQTPNGLDGARPQAGLNEAGVVFEAIAEAGITRFAAIYQNPDTAVIGPIRSLRTYYLEWDTPFDCTIVHAGGSADALANLASGGYRDLTENYAYMYRGTYSNRLWNNLFTTSAYLQQFNNDVGSTTSNVKGFSRMTPEESETARIEATAVEKLNITEAAEGDTSATSALATEISIRFGSVSSFNVKYIYDATTNAYLRYYESGEAHEVYDCPAGNLGEVDPENYCSLVQLSPSVVIAMIVEESKASDNYHEDITTIGSGEAYIFQNGIAIHGYWTKSSKDSQIVFTNENGEEVKLAPGQTFISAVPEYGSVSF